MTKILCLFWGTFLIVPFCAWAQDVRLGNDFYTFVNQKWLSESKIPANSVQWDNFAMVDSINQARMKQILENFVQNNNLPADSPEKMLGNYYQSGIDTLSIEKQGITPLLPYFAKIDALKDYKDLLRLMVQQYAEGNGSSLGFAVEEDLKNSSKRIVTFKQTNAHLPNAMFYTAQDEYFVKIQKGYLVFVEKMLSLINESNTKQKATDLFALEKEFATSYLSLEEMYDPEKTYHKMSIADFEKITPHIPWHNLLNTEMGLGIDSVNVTNIKFYQKFDEMLTQVPIETWKAKMKFLLVLRYTYALPFAFRDAMEDLNAVFSGRKMHLARWKRILYECQGEVLSKAFGDRYYQKEVETKLLGIIKNIQKTYETELTKNTWMSKETKAQALKKLKAMRYKLGYSKSTPNLDGLIYLPDQYLQNNMQLSAYLFIKQKKSLNSPIDKTKWQANSTDVNAYYDPNANEFILTAGILQPPFFGTKADDAVNYGAIACIIAHEMSHAFDNNGRKYDVSGNLNDWWKKEDEERFNALAEKLVMQFSAYKIDTVAINGRLTLGENIADLGAVNIAYKAFLLTEEGKKNTIRDGFTARQRFFISYATMWRIQKEKRVLLYSLQTNTHAPNQYRVNGVLSNFTPFYEAFGISEGDKMFRVEAERLRIW